MPLRITRLKCFLKITVQSARVPRRGSGEADQAFSMVCICHLHTWNQIYSKEKCKRVTRCVWEPHTLAVASWLSLCHNTRVIVVAAVPLCDNGGFQERGREELGAPPTKTIC